MNPERSMVFKETNLSDEKLGKKFIDKWLVPELGNDIIAQNPNFLNYTGKTLKFIGEGFPKSDPDWSYPNWIDRLSLFDIYDLNRRSTQNLKFKELWQEIHKNLNRDLFLFPKGSVVDIRDYDFLVTTPLAGTKNAAQESIDAIKLFRLTGKIDYYFRSIWPFAKNLKIGSKFLYVDNRAIRGFAVVTDIDITEFNTKMDVDTWRWIDPIPCDYGVIKPPQGYSGALKHKYLENTKSVKVIGEWLDPMSR